VILDLNHRFNWDFGGGNLRTIDADLFKSNVKAWAENIRDFRSDNKCFFTEENILKAIDDQPTVEVEVVKHGHWINAYPDIEPNPMLMYGICSECGFKQSISDSLKFCPECGAKMDGSE